MKTPQDILRKLKETPFEPMNPQGMRPISKQEYGQVIYSDGTISEVKDARNFDWDDGTIVAHRTIYGFEREMEVFTDGAVVRFQKLMIENDHGEMSLDLAKSMLYGVLFGN